MNTLWTYGGKWPSQPVGEGFDLSYVTDTPMVDGGICMVHDLKYLDQTKHWLKEGVSKPDLFNL